MEIHVLERCGDLLTYGIVQQVDAHLILVLCFDCGFHNEKRFCSPTCKTRSTECRQDIPRRPISTRYIEMMIDMLPLEMLMQEAPVRLDIHFLRECRYGQTLAVGLKSMSL